MTDLPTAAVAMPTLPPIAPIPTGGTWSTIRDFVVPQFTAEPEPTEVPEPEEIDAALTAAADSIEDNGATPGQAKAMREITRIVMESGNPPAAAGRVVELIEQAKAAEGCTALDGQCERHTNDHGEIIHRSLPRRASAAGDSDLLTHSLIQWGDDKPRLEFVGAGTWPDLNLPDVDALIAATERQLVSLRDCRAHLAAALGEAPPTQPPEDEKAQQATSDTTSTEFARREVERIAASLGAQIVEVAPANKPEQLKNTEVFGWYDATPTPRLIFPAGQAPAERLATARQIAAALAVTA